jgi:hypothetical protein
MTKNVVVCCDGTANEFKRDRTNVVKLFQALVKDPGVQACYYHPGVGTMAAPGFVTRTGINAGARLHRFPEQRCINNADENALEHGLTSWALGWGQMAFGRVGDVAA